MKPVLPADFVQTILNTFKGDGERWLGTLPDLLEEASRRWGLTNIQPVPNLTYNFVAFADSSHSPLGKTPGALREASGEANKVVLKVGVPNRELTGEFSALRVFKGRGAVQLLDGDLEKGILLLERPFPGNMLTVLEDDDHATEIAADAMSQLWQCGSDVRCGSGSVATTDLIQLKDWFRGFKRLRKRFNGKTGPLPEHMVAKAESLAKGLLSASEGEVLLHGDFHHFNLLEAARGWLAIDPKGVIGPRGYEVGPLLINPKPEFLNASNPKDRTERRIAILSERLDMAPGEIRAWGFCHAVLSAWWSVEDNDPERGEYAIRCAEIFAEVHA